MQKQIFVSIFMLKFCFAFKVEL